MYGQTSGAAGEALRGMDATYPRAMAYLRAADDAGRAGRAVTTYGGRRVPVWPTPAGLDESQARAVAAARGRFTRNAVIQGAAAELFKAWAATVRLAVADLDARIVLCLHDELLVEAPRATRRRGRRRAAPHPGLDGRALVRLLAGPVRRRRPGRRAVVGRQGLTGPAAGAAFLDHPAHR